MDEHYDVIVCGTGLKESIITGLLAVDGLKVLHLDRNSYYGSDTASLNLTQLWEKYKPDKKPPRELGENREWNVDVIPKFVMGCGDLVKILQKTQVTRYLEWAKVEGTFVYQYQKAAFGGFFSKDKAIHKVPATVKECLGSNLMGLLEQNRCRLFLQYVAKYSKDDPNTWDGISRETPMREVFDKFGLGDSTVEFIGHAIALEESDTYLRKPCGPTLDKLVLYVYSLVNYVTSPFIYPIYGIGGLPESFARLAAVHGTTYMLDMQVKSITRHANGKASGLLMEDGTKVTADAIVCEPSYMSKEDIEQKGSVVRAICFLNQTPKETNGRSSCQIIIPSNQVNRKNDIYVAVLSSEHKVCKKGFCIAVVATTVETSRPKKELQPALDLFEDTIVESFFSVSPYLVPKPKRSGTENKIFCTESYDAESHFESATRDVLSIYKQMRGKDLDLENIPDHLEDDDD